MSENQSGRDEKGLTLSSRTMLRLLVQFTKLLAASNKLGDPGGYELLQSPLAVVELRSLLWIATEMGKRIGSISEVEAYLATHAQEDEKVINEGLIQSNRSILEEVLENSDLQKCEKCGSPRCLTCQECHNCESELDSAPKHTPTRIIN